MCEGTEKLEVASQSQCGGEPPKGDGYGLQNHRFTMHELQHLRIRMSQCRDFDEGDIFFIDPKKCTECEGSFDRPNAMKCVLSPTPASRPSAMQPFQVS